MQFQLFEAEQAFADQVEEFIAQHWLDVAEPRRRLSAWQNAAGSESLRQQWYRSVVEVGWSVPHWPIEYGGCDWTRKQLHIWLSACLKYQTPAVLTFATAHVGPLLIEHGNAQQRALLQRMATFEESWCLGWADRRAATDSYGVNTRILRTPRQISISGTKTRVIDGMTAAWMMCVTGGEGNEPNENRSSIVLLPLDQKGVKRDPKAALSTGRAMAEIVLNNALAASWATLDVPLDELRRRLTGLAPNDLSALADSAALTEQVRQLKDRVAADPNMEFGLLRDCDALAIEASALLGMEQRAITQGELPLPAVRLRAQTLWGKLSELQIAAFGYYAMPFVDSALADNEGAVDNTRPVGEMDMTMVMRRMLSPAIATELGVDLHDSIAQEVLGLPVQDE